MELKISATVEVSKDQIKRAYNKLVENWKDDIVTKFTMTDIIKVLRNEGELDNNDFEINYDDFEADNDDNYGLDDLLDFAD